jgi:hypothetical protein
VEGGAPAFGATLYCHAKVGLGRDCAARASAVRSTPPRPAVPPFSMVARPSGSGLWAAADPALGECSRMGGVGWGGGVKAN